MAQRRRRDGGRRIGAALSLGIVALLMAGPAGALPIDQASSGVFLDAVVDAGSSVRGEGTQRLRWRGARGPWHVLRFRGSETQVDSGEAFSLGTLRYFDRRARGSESASVDLLVQVALGLSGGAEEAVALTLHLNHAPGAGGSPGSVLVAGGLPAATVTLGGVEYTLELMGLEWQPKPGRGFAFGRFASAQILARMTESAPAAIPSPEPDAALLYLVGLAVAGARLRRRRG